MILEFKKNTSPLSYSKWPQVEFSENTKHYCIKYVFVLHMLKLLLCKQRLALLNGSIHEVTRRIKYV